MYKWGPAPSLNCDYGLSEQTADHVLIACSIHWALHGARGLTVLNDQSRAVLTRLLPAFNPGSTQYGVVKGLTLIPSPVCVWPGVGAFSNDDDENHGLTRNQLRFVSDKYMVKMIMS